MNGYEYTSASDVTSSASFLGLRSSSGYGNASIFHRVPSNPLNLEHQRRRGEVQSAWTLISKFTLQGEIFEHSISVATAVHSKILMDLLDPVIPLPKMSVDADGGLLMVWESAERTLLATVTGDRIDITSNAGTLNAEFYPDIPLRAGLMPDEFRNCLQEL